MTLDSGSSQVRVQKSLRTGSIVSFAAWIGFVMVYFDSSLYIVAAPFIAPFFFPPGSYMTSVLLFLLTYPVGYLGRPVGGLIWGHYGDRLGRKKPWLISVAGMGLATISVGFLPTYSQVGALAAVLLVVLRLLQGIFLGGENTGSSVMSIESVPDHLRGLFGGLVRSGFAIGLLLASADLLLATTLYPGAALQSFGWRFMFFIGAIPLIVALISRRVVQESPEWEAKVGSRLKAKRSPILQLFREHPRTVLLILLFTFGYDIVAQDTTLYIPTFLRLFTPASVTTVALAGIVPNLVRGVASPIVGYASDVIQNRKWMLYFAAVALAVTSYPLFGMINGGSLYPVLIGTTTVFLLYNIILSLAHVFQSELVPTNVRWGLNGISELGTTFAAFGPFVAAFVGSQVNDPLLAVTGVVTIGAIIIVIALYLLPKDRAGQPL
jgi:MFS family permease